MRARFKGFTLIELLIVVAIIAILAAIAVPNFLEARVRATVSRVKADQRTYSTAIQAYAVDWNQFPPWLIVEAFIDSISSPSTAPAGKGVSPRAISPDGLLDAMVPFEETLLPLSTPVAYMSDALLVEPFNGKKGVVLYRGHNALEDGIGGAAATGEKIPIYLYITLPPEAFDSALSNPALMIPLLGAGSGGIPITEDMIGEVLRKRFFIASPGPDTYYTYDRCVTDGIDTFSCIFTQFNDAMIDKFAGVYDPTNGTISRGEVVRTSVGIAMDK